ncbi:unnamed protein product [Chondrus crispus]|uniref:Uncharacterized protein n=1 Tax=Chondrus crispus TaxID=2769 RepID=R7QAP4_CHOCR|nr:unnamed protein product [Chondrus crispus]CDF34520.1 unnamed protein product [Chondrus crispus]|eukprot:XP_005714339.1 unnamed protein product [Chondrus crispus]
MHSVLSPIIYSLSSSSVVVLFVVRLYATDCRTELQQSVEFQSQAQLINASRPTLP